MDWCRIFIMPGTWNVSSSHPLHIVIILLSDDIFRGYWPASGSAGQRSIQWPNIFLSALGNAETGLINDQSKLSQF